MLKFEVNRGGVGGGGGIILPSVINYEVKIRLQE